MTARVRKPAADVKIMWFGTAKWKTQVKDTRHGLLYMGPTCLVVGLPVRISYN